MAAGTDSDTDKLDAAVRRTAGIAALRRLRALVDTERAQDDADARALPIVVAAIAGLILVVVVLPLLWRLLA